MFTREQTRQLHVGPLALGGDAPERDFDESDPAYEALRAMDKTGLTTAEKEGDRP